MRVRRSNDAEPRRSRQIDVIGEAALPGQESPVFTAKDPGADSGLAHVRSARLESRFRSRSRIAHDAAAPLSAPKCTRALQMAHAFHLTIGMLFRTSRKFTLAFRLHIYCGRNSSV